MDWNSVEGNWQQMKGKVKEMWGKLTNDDLEIIKGKRQQLSGKLQEKYGYISDKANKEIERFLSMYKPKDASKPSSCEQ